MFAISVECMFFSCTRIPRSNTIEGTLGIEMEGASLISLLCPARKRESVARTITLVYPLLISTWQYDDPCSVLYLATELHNVNSKVNLGSLRISVFTRILRYIKLAYFPIRARWVVLRRLGEGSLDTCIQFVWRFCIICLFQHLYQTTLNQLFTEFMNLIWFDSPIIDY